MGVYALINRGENKTQKIPRSENAIESPAAQAGSAGL